jgi:pimeloyl-ACP methyl ester carboxylesterase
MGSVFFPLLVALAFLLLFLFTLRRTHASAPEVKLTDFLHSKDFGFGKLAYYDNLNEHNKAQTPWIFIHSIGSSYYSWRYQLQHFSETQRIIAVDLLGFGQSDKPPLADYHLDATTLRLTEFLDSLDVQRGYLVGCSLGGALCLWLAKLQPERFPKVVAIAPAATPTLVPLLNIQHEKLAVLGKRLVSRALIRAALRGGLAHRNKITPQVVESYFAPFKNPDAVTSFLKSVSIIKDARIFNSLGTVTTPVLIVWGERDRVVQRSAMIKIVQSLPQARLLTHKNGGHHLMEDEPEWVNTIISDYFHSTES